MSSDDITSGAVKGAISWSEDKIKEFVKNFKERKLAFIQDSETIDLVKEQLKSGEWDLCKKYLRDDKLKILVQMGLTLRRLDTSNNYPVLKNLRDRIVKKYGEKGLHIAQFVQNKILSDFIGSYVSTGTSIEDLITDVESLLNNLEKNVLFVKAEDKPEKLLRDIEIKLTANVPSIFIIFARQSAYDNGAELKHALLAKGPANYRIEIKQEKEKLLLFLFKEDRWE
ncbi:MAG: hypothetical protein ACP5N3_03260 [Candidatus Nanoarchaeia archaeon]